MADSDSLALAFLSSHPLDAARVVEALSPEEAAALFARVPARAVAPALTAMLPAAGARALLVLDDVRVLGLLTAAGPQGAVALLRHVPEPRRSRLIDGLPTVVAVASRMLLGFPEDSVGAWVDPDLVALPPETRVGEALARLRSGAEGRVEEVQVVGPGRELLGCVDLHLLLRVPEGGTLAPLLRAPAGVLAAMTPLASAAADRGWARSTALPVVDRAGRLIGVLRRITLDQARAHARALEAGAETGEDSIAGLLGRGYWDMVSGLVQAGLGLLPPVRPVLGDKE